MLTIGEITERLTPVFEQNGITRAMIFGSYAKGAADEASDVDIVIETESYVRGMMFYGILDQMIEVLGISVDMLPKRSIQPNSKVALEIENTGRVIYERQ